MSRLVDKIKEKIPATLPQLIADLAWIERSYQDPPKIRPKGM